MVVVVEEVGGTAPGLPGPEVAFEVGWSSSSSEEPPVYATKPVFSLFTAGAAGPCGAFLSSTLGLAPFTAKGGGGISCLLSLSHDGLEELCGWDPGFSGLPMEKPAPKLVI